MIFFKGNKKKKQETIQEDTNNTHLKQVSHYDPEYADNYIYAAEHGYLMPPKIFDESWEKYKEDVGYYERHPEREEESRKYVANCIEQDKKYIKKRLKT